jgi:hypothetical protein
MQYNYFVFLFVFDVSAGRWEWGNYYCSYKQERTALRNLITLAAFHVLAAIERLALIASQEGA